MVNGQNSKRIAKNTILLYLRMFLTMAISLYTSRIILKTLGVDDFGIYNVVGGIVIMFSFLSSTMSSATQRFYSFELGKSNLEQLSRVFKMTVNIHMIIAVIILILSETIGLWFLNTVLIIPDARMCRRCVCAPIERPGVCSIYKSFLKALNTVIRRWADKFIYGV